MKYADNHLLRIATALVACIALAGPVNSQSPEDRRGVTIKVIDCSTPGPAWRIVNDGVMGGLSSSSMVIEKGIGIFSGKVSLANNGGFASTRTVPAQYDLGGFIRLLLRVRGDGKRYQVRLRTNNAFDGVSYQALIDPPAGRWVEIAVPFGVFVPVYRGRVVSNYRTLDPADIRTFGLLIADKQVGPFRLELDWIAVAGADRQGAGDGP